MSYAEMRLHDLPFERKLQVHAAAVHDTRMNILRELDNNRYHMLYTHVKDVFCDLEAVTLDYHLWMLEEASLIEKYGQGDSLRYNTTPLGREVSSMSYDELTAVV